MRRITILIILLLSCMGVLFAQAPEKFTYQAVVRNSNNQLVVNTQVGVQVVILRGSAQGSIVYGERHTQGTNANGLITLNIGEGNIIAGQFSNIDWSSGVFFISVGIDPVGGTDYTIWSTQQLLSVPYALYAKEAGNGFSGNYNDLTNLPQIPQIPINVSVFNNDAGYITMDSIPPIPTIPSNVSAFANDVGYITMDSVPPIPTIPTNVSAFNNDAGYLQSYTETDPQYNAWNKDYNDLINKPAIPTVPTNVGAFANDAGYITMDSVPQIPTNVSAFTNDAGYLQSFTETQNLANVTALGNSAGNRQLKDVADPTDSYDAVNLRSLTLVMDSAQAIIQQMQLQLSQSQQQWQIQQQQIQQQWQETQQQWQIQQMQLQQQIDSLTLILNAMAADTAFTQWNTSVVNETACNTYEWHNQTYTQSGVYLYGFTNTDGSNNVEALNLTIVTSDTTHLQEEACESYILNNTTYTESGDYYLFLTNQSGCDSVVFLHLTVHQCTHNVVTDTACETYTWHNVTYDESGVYTYAYTNEYGCASADTLHLTVYHGTHIVVTDTVCESYIWHDSTYTESGVYTYAYTNEHGCASVDTLKLTVHYGTHNLTDENACGSYEWHGQTYSESGTYNYIYSNEYGCPSEDTLKVVVVAVDAKSCPAAPCVTDIDGNMYRTVQIGDQCWMRSNLRVTHFPDGTAIPAGNTTSNTTPYYYNKPNSYYSLEHRGYLYNWPAVMHNQSSSTTNPSGVQGICPDGWHVPSDAEWAQLIAYVSSQSAFGCEGNNAYYAKALALQTGWSAYSYPSTCVVGNNQSQNNATGFSAVPAGQYYGSYVGESSRATFWSSSKIGSAYNYSLFEYSNTFERAPAMDGYGFSVRCLRDENGGINPPTPPQPPQPDCSSYSINISGNTTLCRGESATLTASEASSYSWSNGSNTASVVVSPTTTTTYSVTGTSSQGCVDSASVTVVVNPAAGTSISVSTCNSYEWHGQTYNQSNTYTYAYNNEYGCAVADTLHLTIKPIIHNIETQTACESYTWHGQTYTQTNTYTYSYNNDDNCPSVDTLFLTIYQPTTTEFSATACESYVWNGIEYTQSGDYTQTFTTAHGCDSVVTLHLTVHKGTHNNVTAEDCESYTWHGQTYTQTNTYTYSYNNDDNCPSVDTLFLTIYESAATAFSVTVCESYVWNGIECTQNGDYTQTFTTAHGCDSVVTLHLTISNEIPNVSTDTVCDSFSWHDSTFIESGTYTYIDTTSSLCPIVDTLHLTIYKSTYNGFTDTAEGPYTWHGQTYFESGTYLHIDTNANGCPSVDTLNLTIITTDTIYSNTGCPGMPIVMDHEGNVYNTVKIGGQCWTRENMRCVTSPLTGDTLLTEWSAYTGKAANWNPYNVTRDPAYGLLYNWCAALDTFDVAHNYPEIASIRDTSFFPCTFSGPHRGICPEGWHVPDTTEWGRMLKYVHDSGYQCPDCSRYGWLFDGDVECIAKALSSTTGWDIDHYTSCSVGNDLPANNATGFSALPGGHCYLDIYRSFGEGAFFWSATMDTKFWNEVLEDTSLVSTPYHYVIYNDDSYVEKSICSLNDENSVRCVRDYDNCGTHHDLQISSCDSYTWHGQTYTESGTYYYGYTNELGCPCTERLYLTINDGTHNVVTAGDCQYYVWHGHTYDTSGTYTYEYVNEHGCPSVDTLKLTIQPHVYLTFYEEAENEYHWHGQTYYASGTYVYEDTNDHGCPYTDTLHLTFINGEPCTGTPVVIDVDGNIYHTVQIGNQCWMKENLRVTRRTDSTSIPYESNPDVTVSLQGDEQQYLTAPYWCYPDNNPANKNTYGLLYNWPAASGICPTGWHLPSRAEWQQLISYVSSQTEYVCGNDNDNIAKALAAQTGWPESSVACAVGNTPSTNNTTGFSAYPAGSYGNNYLSYGNLAVFWSTTQYYSEYFAYCCHLTFNEASADGGSFNIKSNAVSVRCLRD